MKKIISLILCLSTVFASLTAFATVETAETVAPPAQDTASTPLPTDTPTIADTAIVPTEEPTQTPIVTDINPELAQNQVTVTANIEKMPYIKSSEAVFELFDKHGKSLGTDRQAITPDTDKIVLTFNVPTFNVGEHFTVRAVEGLDSVLYYENRYFIGKDIDLPTYTYTDENNQRIFSTDIAVTIRPLYNKSINVYYNGDDTFATGARIIDGVAMVPIRTLAEFIGFDVRYDNDYNVEVVSLDGKDMYFNIDNTYTTIFGTDLFAPYPTTMIDGTVYVALRTFADAIGSTLDVRDYFTYMDINISESSFVSDYYRRLPVNQWNISSKTNYMVWVSLSEYKVRLYEGKKNRWKLLLEAPCAIGAPGTPSVTGSFEYLYKTRWDYGTYYVGPCLVFYRGYALHSVLLYQNGTEYDGRVGVQISHGCIRLKKSAIDYIANTIPVGTRIYCTK